MMIRMVYDEVMMIMIDDDDHDYSLDDVDDK